MYWLMLQSFLSLLENVEAAERRMNKLNDEGEQ